MRSVAVVSAFVNLVKVCQSELKIMALEDC